MVSQRILVLDDDSGMGMLIAEFARILNLPCTVTTDAEGFLQSLTPEITLIFLELVMPDMDGVEILRALAHKGCRAAIVMMSDVGERIMDSASTLGVSLGLHMLGSVTKPFSIAELESLVAGGVEPSHRSLFCPHAEIAFRSEELLRAVDRDELVLHYQPQIEIATGRVVGVEGLVRWQHPKHGLVFPDSFMEDVEKIGLIDQLTVLVFRHGLSEISLFSEVNRQPLTLSLNVRVGSLLNLQLPNRLMELVHVHGCKPSNMILEIAESGLIRETSRVLDVLTRLRLKNVQLSIDDFGTGHFMMQQLRNIPATELKIDKSIVQSSGRADGRIILQKMIELGHELGMKVVGEGVETQEQFDFLRSKGCDTAQGYLFSRPVPSENLIGWLAEYRSSLNR